MLCRGGSISAIGALSGDHFGPVSPSPSADDGWRGRVFVVSGGVFEEGRVEVNGGLGGLAEELGGDGEDVVAQLKFQNGAGGDHLGSGSGEIALAFHLAIAGGGEGRLDGGKLREQLLPEDGLMFGGGGDEAVQQSYHLPEPGLVGYESLAE